MTQEQVKDIQKKAKLYHDVLNNDEFLNDCFTSLGATDRLQILVEAGINLEKEYKQWLKMRDEVWEGENDYEDNRPSVSEKAYEQLLRENTNG